jgi:hypothetical protein
MGAVDELVMTEADWWSVLHDSDARWRTSRTTQWCANQRLPGDEPSRCGSGGGVAAIEPGDIYFDTGEALNGSARTLHLCAPCAQRRWT